MRTALVLFVSLTLCAATALGATIYMKDGRKFEGEIVSRTDKEIKLKLADGKTKTLDPADVKSIDEPIPPPPKVVSNETGDAPADRRTKEYERWLDSPLATATGEFVVVRGDHPVEELKRMAEACDKIAQHFLRTFECQPTDVLRGDKYGPARVDVLQFWKEDGYLAFCDKVLARIRDDTVDDARLAFLRRQRGFWIVSPRAVMAQYQGPSDLVTSISGACHKTSHVLLAGYKPSGSFMPWWLYEGFATWQLFAALGETRTYCLDLARPADYARAGSPEADEAAKARTEPGWRAKVKQRVSRRNEKEFAALGKMSLNELVLEDVQQSWSLVDWLHQTARLKQFVTEYKMTRDLDGACRTVFGVPTSAAHEQWRAWVLRAY
jgi:hypothetical protein